MLKLAILIFIGIIAALVVSLLIIRIDFDEQDRLCVWVCGVKVWN
jgi:hypothetical protein